jgi:aminobenzoyl-glutamate utilization protein B
MRGPTVSTLASIVAGSIVFVCEPSCRGPADPVASTARTSSPVATSTSASASGSALPAASWTSLKTQAAKSVDRGADTYVATSRKIFDYAETALTERKSSKELADLAEQNGFKVQRGVAGMETAWVATWSCASGGPTIGVLAEFDALPSLSQKPAQATKEPVVEGKPGHGCGHNLFGVAATAAAIAMKQALESEPRPCTIKLYGTPAEEQGIGKIFMVRDGLFDGVDAVLSWHPADRNEVHLQPTKAAISFEVTFHGRSAHASAAPWDGVSALDALEAFEHGVNLLREHVPETARMHYVVSDGGGAPNVVPNRARIWMYVRGKDWPEAEKVYAHVEQMVTGADMIAWGEEYRLASAGYQPPEITRLSGLYEYNINYAGSELMQRNFELVGAAAYSESEQQFARDLQKSFGQPEAGFSTKVVPFDRHRPPEPGGSTDVANVSWTTPTVELRVATWPEKVPAHSWASTAASGSTGAFKAMLVAAKVLATTGLDFATDAAALASMKAEFAKSRESFHYSPAVRPEDKPMLPTSMRAALEATR